MVWTPLVRPVTWTGTLLSGGKAAFGSVEPLPSWPLLLEPQHFAAPPVTIAQLWLCPAAIASTPLVRPVTWTGAPAFVPVTPLPSCPVALAPQHLTAPLASAQVWFWPA